MVVVGELVDDALQLSAVNACIQFLPALDGKALFTVEDLQSLARGHLHPVQRAMVDMHASQCGFCTPGFVMSLWALYENHPVRPDREKVMDALSGNLCRCTGYRPILDAADAAYDAPRVVLDREPVIAALREMADLPALDYAESGRIFLAPRSLDALAQCREAYPDARLVAGSTDVGLLVTKQLENVGDIIHVNNVAALNAIQADNDWIDIGAAVRLNEAFDAMIADYPEWTELERRFASVPIRNAGTLGGNVANGSPVGDTMPGLIALGACVVLCKGAGVNRRERELPLEDFYPAHQRTALAPGEFVRGVRIPRRSSWDGKLVFRTYKISQRFEQDISAVCAAFALRVDGGKVVAARIAFGGMAATPKRASACEAVLIGHDWAEATAKAAIKALGRDYQPQTDMRATDEYRLGVAGNLLHRFWLETTGQAESVRVTDFAAVMP
jgi:xanthine dehydrogenase small subunit